MAGTRGLAQLRGKQLNDKILRNRHFDENYKIDEKYIDLKWHEHREILEDTKIDVWVQVNDLVVSGLGSVDVTDAVGGRPVSTGEEVEGVVLGTKVELRKTGTDDFPKIDPTGERIYGKIREDGGSFFLDFYVNRDGIETPYSFPADADNIDYRFIVRTNLSVIPVDAIVSGGSGFVEGATDAKAYMNLLQLMKDLYGADGVLNGDGNAILDKSIVEQIAEEIQNRINAIQQLRDDLADSSGASLIGVELNPNYDGLTVQDVLIDIASRLTYQEENGGAEVEASRTRDQDSPNGYFKEGDYVTLEGRLIDIENTADAVFKDFEDRIKELETEDEEEVYEAVGGETSYMLTKGKAKPNSVLLFINGLAQAPYINFDYITDEEGLITGFNFEPETLEVHEGRPDVLFVKYKKVI